MTKRATTFSLTLPLRRTKTSAYRWLYDSLRAEILAGHLRSGDRLPATRDLARQYKLSRGTIVSAFDILKSEGYLQGTIGSGTYVSKILPEALFQVRRAVQAQASARANEKPCLSGYARHAKLFPAFEIRPSRAFRANLPALDLFPTTLWTQITTRRLRRASVSLLLGCDALGYKPLRDAVTHYLTTSRGVNCSSDQVAIVSGTQEALDLSARLLLNPGDRVAMEDPGYIGARMVFQAVGATISAVPVDDDGMKVQAQKLRGSRLVYVTPGHQLPLGITMGLPRRLELLAWAQKSRALIFEDDYDSEYRYRGRPIPALQGFDRHGSVIFAGSFSKVLFPSLRLGYLVIPPGLVDRVRAAISLTTRHAPLMDQAVLCDFITEGHFGRHLRRMREVYAGRLSVLLQEAKEKLAGLLEISDVEAGLQTVGWLHRRFNAKSAAKAAAARNVEVVPLSQYTDGSVARQGLQLGFATIDSREIRRGIQDLAIALETLA
jgi:GntR family transcriptional regulator / MocR family aminotransferase